MALTTGLTGAVTETVPVLKDAVDVLGLTPREMTALIGGGHSLGSMHSDVTGYTGAWTTENTIVSNAYFQNLLGENWQPFTGAAPPGTTAAPEPKPQYKADGKELYMLSTDLVFGTDPELASIATDFAADNDMFLAEFAAAWSKLVNADRFDGPLGNVCTPGGGGGGETPPSSHGEDNVEVPKVVLYGAAGGAAFLLLVVGVAAFKCGAGKRSGERWKREVNFDNANFNPNDADNAGGASAPLAEPLVDGGGGGGGDGGGRGGARLEANGSYVKQYPSQGGEAEEHYEA